MLDIDSRIEHEKPDLEALMQSIAKDKLNKLKGNLKLPKKNQEFERPIIQDGFDSQRRDVDFETKLRTTQDLKSQIILKQRDERLGLNNGQNSSNI